MAISSGDNNSGGQINDINITPFVDIVLVLLIVFMISAPVVVQSSLGIHLPPAASAENRDHITLHFFIMKDSTLRIEGKPIEEAKVGDLLAKVKATNPDFDVVVSADESISHGTVIRLLDKIRVLGTTQVGIGTERKGSPKAL